MRGSFAHERSSPYIHATPKPETKVARAQNHRSLAEPARDGAAAPLLDGYTVESQVGFLLRRAHQRQTAIWQACMAEGVGEKELTPRQFTALVRVVTNGRVTQNQLGRLAAMDPATIQGVARRLIARGLVARALDPMDRRTAVLTPTEAGIALASRGVAHARRATDQTLSPLDPAERRTLLALLARIA
jgi:DNA-binding MarR family transcriptional regulator